MEVNTTTTTDPINMYNSINNIMINPIVFIILFVIVIIYVIMFASLGKNSSSSSSSSFISSEENTNWTDGQQLLGIIIAGILVFLIIANAFQYFFNISVSAYINDLFTNKPKIDIVVDQGNYQPAPVPEIKFKKQVFNIPGNYYNYDDAQTLCKAYNSRLATYDEVEEAYNKGGEWCNYGWSSDQMALFPTQKLTWYNLQRNPKHKNDCGRPGVNGGYMENPYIRFGVNCFGKKPAATDKDKAEMNANKDMIVPKTEEEIELDKKVQFWKENADKLLNINSFNRNKWSEY
jgi:hypothetical protein